MARDCPICDLGRPIGDHHHPGQMPRTGLFSSSGSVAGSGHYGGLLTALAEDLPAPADTTSARWSRVTPTSVADRNAPTGADRRFVAVTSNVANVC